MLATDSVRPKHVKYYYVCLQILAAVGIAAIQLRYALGQMALETVGSGTASRTLIVVANGLSWGLLTTLGLFVGARGFGSVLTEIYAWIDTVDRRLRRYQRMVLLVGSVGTATILEATWTEPTPPGSQWLIPPALLMLVLYLLLVWQVAVPGYTVRRAESDERERIEHWYDEVDALGNPPSSIIVFDEETRPASVIAGGWRSTHWIWVHERLLSDVDDETLGIALTQAESKHRSHFWPSFAVIALFTVGSFVMGVVVLLELVLAVSLPASFYLVLIGGCGGLGVTTWTVRRITYRADDEVAATFGPGRVVDAYQRIETLNFMPIPFSVPVLESVTPEPTTDRCIARLSERDSVETSLDDALPSSRDKLDGLIPPRTWPILIGVCTSLWIPGGLLIVSEPQLSLSAEAAFAIAAVLAVSWFGLPVGIYVDALRSRSVSEWPGYPKIVTLLSMVWFLNVVVGCWYLWKRRRRSTHRSSIDPS